MNAAEDRASPAPRASGHQAPVAAPAPRWDISRHWAWLLVLCAAALPWISLTDHPAWPPEEGRYGQVAAHMVESGSWLVPVFDGHAHLTKPPLSYWAIAAATELFGRGAAAVRVPSALATSALIVMLFAFGARTRSRTAGAAAALLFGVMPITMIAGRLGAPDAMMALAWTGSICAGLCAIEPGAPRARRIGWSLLFWLAAGLAMFLKAPIGLAPVFIVYAGLAVAGRWRDMLRLGPWWGLPLALAPLGLWGMAVAQVHPELLQILWNESVGRATGGLGKRSPWWTYIPVFLGGLWPATAMMTLPFFNLSLREAWRRARAEPTWLLAILGPLLVFSLSKGKLPHYLLPVAPPLALLCGAMLAGWINGRFAPDGSMETGETEEASSARNAPAARAAWRAPDVRYTYFITAALGCGALAAATAMAPESMAIPGWWGWVLLPAALGGAVLVSSWPLIVQRRRALLLAWATLIASWIGMLQIENAVFRGMGAPKLAPQVEQARGNGGRLLAVVDGDTTRPYYFGDGVAEFGERPSDAIAAAEAVHPGDIVLLDPRVETEFFRGTAMRGLVLAPLSPRIVRLLWWRDASLWRVESPEKSPPSPASDPPLAP